MVYGCYLREKPTLGEAPARDRACRLRPLLRVRPEPNDRRRAAGTRILLGAVQALRMNAIRERLVGKPSDSRQTRRSPVIQDGVSDGI